MPLVVLDWTIVPGQTLPEPRIMDDAVCFKATLVKEVRDWLNRELEKFLAIRKPTDQRIGLLSHQSPDFSRLPPAEFMYVKGYGPEGPLTQTFQMGTAEIILRKKGGPPVASFHYLSARTVNNLTIVGPRLWTDQKGRL